MNFFCIHTVHRNIDFNPGILIHGLFDTIKEAGIINSASCNLMASFSWLLGFRWWSFNSFSMMVWWPHSVLWQGRNICVTLREAFLYSSCSTHDGANAQQKAWTLGKDCHTPKWSHSYLFTVEIQMNKLSIIGSINESTCS